MQSARNPGRAPGLVAMFSLLAAGVALVGCGMPGAPQPPSLNLPNRVADLSAVRTGDHVALSWTMPKRNTDKMLLKANIAARICRNQVAVAPCAAVAALQLAPDSDGSFTDALPPQLTVGPPRLLTYFVELDNRKGRSAGLSSGASVLAGEAPPAITGLAAAMRPDGVLLSWTPAPPGSPPAAIRLERKLLTPPAKKPSSSVLVEPAEPLEQNFLVEPGAQADRALDKNIRFGETYEYRAQRVARVTVDGKTLELDSPFSSPVRIAAEDIFPPSVPTGLAAVATPAVNGAGPSIDLNWLPDGGVNLAGYIVYRRDVTQAEGAETWRRISPTQPVIGPAYHDADVQPGHNYQYAVSAIGQNGRESARSVEAEETVPAQ
jgi:hypothetical protein